MRPGLNLSSKHVSHEIKGSGLECYFLRNMFSDCSKKLIFQDLTPLDVKLQVKLTWLQKAGFQPVLVVFKAYKCGV